MIAILILPMFLGIIYGLYASYQYAWYILIVVNLFLMQYAYVYLSVVLKQKQFIEKEIKQHQVYVSNPESYPTNVHHVIVIPVYNESISIIQKTLQVICEHEFALDYTIMFALEQKDPNLDQYLKHLPLFVGDLLEEHAGISVFKSPIFHNVLTTIHPEESVKGKHMNLNYALRQLYKMPRFTDLKILVTVTDADAHIPSLYMQYITRTYSNHDEYVLFAPSTTFAQNPSTVPSLVRANDAGWAFGHMTCLVHPNKIMPLSSYSLPLNLIHAMNYWDISEYGFGEDSATMFRAVSWTQKNQLPMDLQAVLIPFNYLSVNANGYFGTIMERYKQSLRHNLAYLMLEKSIHTALEIKTKRMMGLVGCYFECVIMTLLMGLVWVILAMCVYEWTTGMSNVHTQLLGVEWSEFLLKFGCIWMVALFPVLALGYDMNHYFVGKYKLYGLAKYEQHSILAHFDIGFFPISCFFFLLCPAIHAATQIAWMQTKKLLFGIEYEFMVDSSKKQ